MLLKLHYSIHCTGTRIYGREYFIVNEGSSYVKEFNHLVHFTL